MSPTLFIIITLIVFGSIVGLLSITKFGGWLKRSGVWILCGFILVGTIGLVAKEIITGVVYVIGLFNNK